MQIRPVFTVSPHTGASAPAAAAQFAPGEMITAQVVETEQGQVVLRLPQGELLNAKTQASQPLQPGDVVLLLAAQPEDASGRMFPRLELISVNGQPLKAGVSPDEYALLRIQIAPTKANLAAASLLREMGAPLRAETFMRLDRLAARYPSLEPDAAALLAASNLPIDEATVDAFSRWLKSPVRTADFAAATETLAAENPQARALLEASASLLGDISNLADSLKARAVQAGAAEEAARGTHAFPPSLLPAFAELELSPAWPALQRYASTLPESEAKALMAQLAEALLPEAPSSLQGTLSEALFIRYIQPALTQAPPEEAGASAQVAATTPEAAKALAQHDGVLPQETRAMAPDAEPENTEPLRAEAQAALNAEPETSDSAHAHEAQSGQHAKLTDILESLFTRISERQTAGSAGEELAKAASERAFKLRILTAALEQGQEANPSAQKPALTLGQALIRQLQMGSELGNLLYLPLPVTIGELRRDAELYILKRNGRAAKLDESNVTIAVCLNTQNLGRVEALVQVVHYEITLRLRVESEEQRAYFEEHLEKTKALAFPMPYRLVSARVVLQDTPITPLNAGQTLLQAFELSPPGSLDISI